MNCQTYRELHAKHTQFPLPVEAGTSEAYSDWVNHSIECIACAEWTMAKAVEEWGGCVSDFPCVHMAYYSTLQCPQHEDAWECPDVLIMKTKDGYGLAIREGKRSTVRIAYCPWCGTAVTE